MLARVSNIEAFRRWRNWTPLHDDDVEPTVEDLVRSITTDDPSAAMRAGTAFHASIEHVQDGEHAELTALGYTFRFPTAGCIEMPATRECRAYKRFGSLTVTGQVDCIAGRVVWDHKTTTRFDAERYLAGCQWRFYLDLFGADEFRWNVFEIKEAEPLVYDVGAPHLLTAYRYPGMGDDCVRLAADFLEFAEAHLSPETRAAA